MTQARCAPLGAVGQIELTFTESAMLGIHPDQMALLTFPVAKTAVKSIKGNSLENWCMSSDFGTASFSR